MGGYAGFADAILITSVRDHYRALASRPTAKESLETLLSNFLFDRVYLIEVSEPGGKMCYYSRSRYEERKPTACLMGFAANDIRQNFLTSQERGALLTIPAIGTGQRNPQGTYRRTRATPGGKGLCSRR